MKILRDYQKRGVDYCVKIQHPFLVWEMRLGKTTVVIHSTIEWDCKKVLITAPYATLQSWINDVKEDTRTKLCVLNQPTDQRLEILERKFKIASVKYFFISKEGHLFTPEIADYPWDCVICDESTFLKAPERQNKCTRYGDRPSVSKFYCQNFRDVEHRVLLSGLPNPESDLDYFQQLKFLDHKYVAPYTNYFAYREKCCKLYIRKRKYFLIAPAKQRLLNTLKNTCSFLRRTDVGFKDPKVYEIRIVQRNKFYNKILKNIMDSMELINKKGEFIDSTIWAFERHLWQHQLCGGFVRDEFVYNHKLRDMKHLLIEGELKNQKVIIWAYHIKEILIIAKHLKNSTYIYGTGMNVEERNTRLDQFRRQKYKYLIATPQSIKVGTDLSCCDTMIYYSSPPSFETRAQSEDRFINVKQTVPKLIIDMLVEDSVDIDIHASLKAKENRALLTNRMANRLQKEIINLYIKKIVRL